MKRFSTVLVIMLAALLLIAGCNPAPSPTPDPTPEPDPIPEYKTAEAVTEVLKGINTIIQGTIVQEGLTISTHSAAKLEYNGESLIMSDKIVEDKDGNEIITISYITDAGTLIETITKEGNIENPPTYTINGTPKDATDKDVKDILAKFNATDKKELYTDYSVVFKSENNTLDATFRVPTPDITDENIKSEFHAKFISADKTYIVEAQPNGTWDEYKSEPFKEGKLTVKVDKGDLPIYMEGIDIEVRNKFMTYIKGFYNGAKGE